MAAHPDGFDVVIETTGVNPGEEAAVRLAGRHGRVGFIGIPNAPVTLSARTFDQVLRYEITLYRILELVQRAIPGCRVADRGGPLRLRQAPRDRADHGRGRGRMRYRRSCPGSLTAPSST